MTASPGPGSLLGGRYRLGHELGRGGWGVVFAATSEPDGARVALKLLHARALLLRPDALERLRRELSAARAVEHPGVVRALDAGTADGVPFIVYELVPGARPITGAMGGRSLAERVALVRDAAAALGAAHARGIVHRDVTPRNVLVDEAGRVRVTDFGLAWCAGEPPLTRTGVVLGTPGALAPEVALAGSKVATSPRVDVWGLGVLLFEALTGAPPFGANDAVLVGATPSPLAVDPRVPAPLDAVCRRALALEPSARLADGEALAAAVDRALADSAGAAALEVASRPSSARLRRVAGPGVRLGRYVLQARIGAGGMGAVFRARDEELGRDVAVKVMHGAESDGRRARFLREQQAAARVRHPHIVAIHEAGETDGLSWLAMDLIEGEALDDVLRRGPLEPMAAARLVAATARAVEALHAAGVLHRDIKPANVLIDERGAPRLTDFGVARVADAERLTRTGQALGTPTYMPLEQLDGGQVDERADVYALGAILYETLAGRLPWDAPSLMALIHAKQSALPPPSRLRPRLPAGLDAVCLRALAPAAEARYPTARALADDLERVLADERPIAGGAARRRRVAAGAVAMALALGGIAAAVAARGAGSAAEATGALSLRRRELEARLMRARSLSAVELDRGGVSDLLARDAAAAPADTAALRACLGLSDLARGDVAAARDAVATLDSAALGAPVGRALRGGVEALTGDPARAVADLEAATRAGLRQPEVEAWRLRALARRGLERTDASAWLRRIPALRAPADARAPAADLLEVACLLALERRIDAADGLARLQAPPAELLRDLATLTATEHARRGELATALEALEVAPRPEGPPRSLEVALARLLEERLASVADEREKSGHGFGVHEADEVLAALTLLRRTTVPAAAALGPQLVRVAQRTVLLGSGPHDLSLFLTVAETWPDDPVVQDEVAEGLLNVRLSSQRYLEPVSAALAERTAAAGARAIAVVTRYAARLAARLVQLEALVALERFDEADRVGAEVEALLAAPDPGEVRRGVDLRFDALVLRARAAAGCGRFTEALSLLDRAEADPTWDSAALTIRFVRHEVLAAAGRASEARELLLELAASPPAAASVAFTRLVDAAWDDLAPAGRWTELRRLYAAAKRHVTGERVWLRLAWSCVREGDLDAAADALDECVTLYGIVSPMPGVRRGDPDALRALEELAQRPWR